MIFNMSQRNVGPPQVGDEPADAKDQWLKNIPLWRHKLNDGEKPYVARI